MVPSDFNTSNVLVLPSYKQCTIYLVNKSTLLKKEKSSKDQKKISFQEAKLGHQFLNSWLKLGSIFFLSLRNSSVGEYSSVLVGW